MTLKRRPLRHIICRLKTMAFNRPDDDSLYPSFIGLAVNYQANQSLRNSLALLRKIVFWSENGEKHIYTPDFLVELNPSIKE
jgi:hypothetical protein